ADLPYAGTFPVNVFVPAGGGLTNAANLTVTPPSYTLTALSPTNIAAGSPGFTLNITGEDFVPGAAAYWTDSTTVTVTPPCPWYYFGICPSPYTVSGSTTALTTTFLDGNRLTAVVPASLLNPATLPAVAIVTVTLPSVTDGQ